MGHENTPILFLSLILLSCAVAIVNAEDSRSDITISGEVVSTTGPIDGLAIILKIPSGEELIAIQTTTTNESGIYTFQNLIYNTTYVVEVKHKNETHTKLAKTDAFENIYDFILMGTVEGVVKYYNGTFATNLPIQIRSQYGIVNDTTTERDGSYAFKNLKIDETYQVGFVDREVSYSKIVQVTSEDSARADFSIYEPTTSDKNMGVNVHHIVISPQEGMLEVMEYIVYQNIGYEVFNNSRLYMHLPKDRKLTKTSVMECCFTQYEDYALIDPMEPIKPEGQFQISVNYKIGINSTRYIFGEKLKYRTGMLGLFVQKDENIEVEAVSGVGNKQITSFNSKVYYSFTGENLGSNSDISVELSGLQPLYIKGPVSPEDSRNWVMWIMPIIIIIAIAAYLLVKKREN